MRGHENQIFRLIQNDQTRMVDAPRSSPPADSTTPPRKPAAAAAPVLNIFFDVELPLDKQVAPRGPAIPPIPTRKMAQAR